MAKDIFLSIVCLVAIFFISSAIDNDKRAQSLEPYRKVVAQSHKPCILHFSMAGCGACAALEPAWKSVQAKYKRQAQFQTIMYGGADKYQLKYAFRIHAYPTLVYIDEHGQYKGRDVGAISEDQLDKEVGAVLNRQQLACNSN